ARVGAMPVIQLGLQTVTLGQQRTVARGQVVHQSVETAPEGRSLDTATGQHFAFDELLELGGYLQALTLHAFGHLSVLLSASGLSGMPMNFFRSRSVPSPFRVRGENAARCLQRGDTRL